MVNEKIYCKNIKKKISKSDCEDSKRLQRSNILNNSFICKTCPHYNQEFKLISKKTLRKKKTHFKKEITQFMGYSLPPLDLEDSLPVYTLHPKKKEFHNIYGSDEWRAKYLNKEPAHMTEIEIKINDPQKMVSLSCKQAGFTRTKNPVLAIEAFLLAYEIGLYPPLWALSYVTEVFKAYHNSLGKKSLDNLFGINKKNQHTSKFKALLNEQRDQMVTRDLFRLTVLGYSINDASAMIAERLNQTEWDRTGLKLKALDADTIQQLYTRKWKYYFNCKRCRENTKEFLEINKDEFLSTFPSKTLKDYKPLKSK